MSVQSRIDRLEQSARPTDESGAIVVTYDAAEPDGADKALARAREGHSGVVFLMPDNGRD